MMKLNLQLFAIDPNSIVDYLKSQGQDSSYSARKEIAKELGITNYKGTAEQNTQMLNTLKNSSTSNKNTSTGSNTPTPTPLPNATGTATPTQIPNATGTPTVTPLVNGVDSSLMDKINGTFSASSGATDAQNNANSALNTLTSMGTPTVSKETMDILNSQFSASSAYNEAMKYTNALLQQLSSGRTSYTDQIKEMMNQIQNRDKFSYDVENDTLFQQALASAMGSGKQAMQDTMGQAAALTGGYASTYSQSVGNQAYNAYIEDAYNNLPEYYQMAMEAYQMEGQDMYNQLAMLNDADATEYQRMYDSWNANFANAQNMYNQEYGAWQDSVNNAYNSANLQLQQQSMAYDQAYNNYQAIQNNADILYSQEYQKWQDEINNAMAMAGMQNSDYWNKTTMENSNQQAQLDREHASAEALLDRNHNAEQAQLDREHNTTEAEKDRTFKAEEADKDRYADYLYHYDLNRDEVVDEKDQELATKQDEEEVTYKSASPEVYDEAVSTYRTQGEAGLMRFLEKYPDFDVEAIYDHAVKFGDLASHKFTKVKTTFNVVGNANNDVVRDEITGEEFKLSELPEDMREILTGLKEGESYDFSANKNVTTGNTSNTPAKKQLQVGGTGAVGGGGRTVNAIFY